MSISRVHVLVKTNQTRAIMDNSEIVERHRVCNQGGIRKSNGTKSFVLITNHKVKKYHDSVSSKTPFEIQYEGAFTRGKHDQEMTRMNKALSETDWDLHVYSRNENTKRLVYEYMGAYKRIGDPIHILRNGRWVYIFTLRRITPAITYDFESFEY
jgi:hypothetical protein